MQFLNIEGLPVLPACEWCYLVNLFDEMDVELNATSLSEIMPWNNGGDIIVVVADRDESLGLILSNLLQQKERIPGEVLETALLTQDCCLALSQVEILLKENDNDKPSGLSLSYDTIIPIDRGKGKVTVIKVQNLSPKKWKLEEVVLDDPSFLLAGTRVIIRRPHSSST